MANVRLEPPDQFDFANPDDWPRWKRRFELYRCASALDKEDEARQVSVLLYSMGEAAADVLTSTNIADEDRKKYAKVVEKFDEFFRVRRNVIFERAKFNSRNQGAEESAEQYITALYSLVETCEYNPEMVEELLRDRLVVGMKDKALSERLQLDPELTLGKAKKMVRQKEAVKEQCQQLQSDKPLQLEAVGGNPPVGRRRERREKPQQYGRGQLCTRCGKGPHPAGARCPARSANCHRCNRKGHYESQCFSKTVASASELTESVTEEPIFLGAISEEQNSPWQISILVENKPVQFKLDTGAQVTAITERTYSTLGASSLKKPSKILYGPARQRLDTIGQFTTRLHHGTKVAKQTVFVVRGLQQNLLGLPAITELQLACRLAATYTNCDVRRRFPRLFTGLGTLGEAYHIRL